MNRPGVGVGVFIIRDRKFLMIKRKGSHGAGTRSVPRGWIEYAETFEDTAQREIMEEVGLEIENVRFGAATNTVFSKESVHSITIWLICDYAKKKEIRRYNLKAQCQNF